MIAALLFTLAQVATSKPSHEALERLRAKTPVVAVRVNRVEELAGRYTSESKELRKRIGGFLSGDELYLFPDGTYIYCEWADIEPTTVYDKGTWKATGGLVELKSDPEITWDPGKYHRYDRRYAAFHRSSRNNEIMLIGVDYALPRFEEEAGDDPAFMLLVAARKRETTFTREKAEKLKAKLMKESWRPEYFPEDPKRK
jgi:hypothetical protein